MPMIRLSIWMDLCFLPKAKSYVVSTRGGLDINLIQTTNKWKMETSLHLKCAPESAKSVP